MCNVLAVTNLGGKFQLCCFKVGKTWIESGKGIKFRTPYFPHFRKCGEFKFEF